jgi:hypothetical protein
MGEYVCGLEDSRCSFDPKLGVSKGAEDALVLMMEAVSNSLLEPVMDIG